MTFNTLSPVRSGVPPAAQKQTLPNQGNHADHAGISPAAQKQLLPDQGGHADHAGRKRSHVSMEEADTLELKRQELRDELAALDKEILAREIEQKPALFS